MLLGSIVMNFPSLLHFRIPRDGVVFSIKHVLISIIFTFV